MVGYNYATAGATVLHDVTIKPHTPYTVAVTEANQKTKRQKAELQIKNHYSPFVLDKKGCE